MENILFTIYVKVVLAYAYNLSAGLQFVQRAPQLPLQLRLRRLGYVGNFKSSDEGCASEFFNAPEEMFKGAVARCYPNSQPYKCPAWLGPAIAAVTLLSLVLALKPGRMPLRIQADLVSGFHQTTIEVSIKNDGTRNQMGDLHNREQKLMKTALVINLDVKDNHEEAAVGAKHAFEFCQKLEAADTWEDEIDAIIRRFEKQYRRRVIYTICFY